MDKNSAKILPGTNVSAFEAHEEPTEEQPNKPAIKKGPDKEVVVQSTDGSSCEKSCTAKIPELEVPAQDQQDILQTLVIDEGPVEEVVANPIAESKINPDLYATAGAQEQQDLVEEQLQKPEQLKPAREQKAVEDNLEFTEKDPDVGVDEISTFESNYKETHPENLQDLPFEEVSLVLQELEEEDPLGPEEEISTVESSCKKTRPEKLPEINVADVSLVLQEIQEEVPRGPEEFEEISTIESSYKKNRCEKLPELPVADVSLVLQELQEEVPRAPEEVDGISTVEINCKETYPENIAELPAPAEIPDHQKSAEEQLQKHPTKRGPAEEVGEKSSDESSCKKPRPEINPELSATTEAHNHPNPVEEPLQKKPATGDGSDVVAGSENIFDDPELELVLPELSATAEAQNHQDPVKEPLQKKPATEAGSDLVAGENATDDSSCDKSPSENIPELPVPAEDLDLLEPSSNEAADEVVFDNSTDENVPDCPEPAILVRAEPVEGPDESKAGTSGRPEAVKVKEDVFVQEQDDIIWADSDDEPLQSPANGRSDSIPVRRSPLIQAGMNLVELTGECSGWKRPATEPGISIVFSESTDSDYEAREDPANHRPAAEKPEAGPTTANKLPKYPPVAVKVLPTPPRNDRLAKFAASRPYGAVRVLWPARSCKAARMQPAQPEHRQVARKRCKKKRSRADPEDARAAARRRCSGERRRRVVEDANRFKVLRYRQRLEQRRRLQRDQRALRHDLRVSRKQASASKNDASDGPTEGAAAEE